MSQSPLDDSLDALRQAFADMQLVLGIVADLRTRADRMKPLILNELRDMRPKLDVAIARLEEDLG